MNQMMSIESNNVYNLSNKKTPTTKKQTQPNQVHFCVLPASVRKLMFILRGTSCRSFLLGCCSSPVSLIFVSFQNQAVLLARECNTLSVCGLEKQDEALAEDSAPRIYSSFLESIEKLLPKENHRRIDPSQHRQQQGFSKDFGD